MRVLVLLCFLGFSQGLIANNSTRGVRLLFDNNCVTLSSKNKNIIVDEYLKIGEGDWLYFTTVSIKEISANRLLAFKNAKIRNRAIGRFLKDNGIEQKQLTYKYGSFEHIWVNKPLGLKSSVRVQNQNDKSNQESQSFKNIDGATFYLQSGNIIEFKSMNFEGLSDEVITVTIKEFTSKSDFVKYGVTAHGDKGMLETQGMYHIEALSNDQKINLRRNTSYNLKIKEGKNEVPFYSFYGKEKNGKLAWYKNAQEKFYSVNNSSNSKSDFEDNSSEGNDTVFIDNEYGEMEVLDGVYVSENRIVGDYLIGRFSRLGWINCDRFYNEEETITMKLKIDNGISVKPYSVYLIFKDINSVLPLYSVTNGTYQTPKIPKGSNVTIFAVQTDGKELQKLGFKDVVTSDEKILMISAKKVSKDEVDKMMNDIIF